jgi:hypothetical protein
MKSNTIVLFLLSAAAVVLSVPAAGYNKEVPALEEGGRPRKEISWVGDNNVSNSIS